MNKILILKGVWETLAQNLTPTVTGFIIIQKIEIHFYFHFVCHVTIYIKL